MTRNLELTIAQISTIKLALIGWGIRCEAEAARMDKWADEMPHHSAKCLANAAASRRMKADSEATLAALR